MGSLGLGATQTAIKFGNSRLGTGRSFPLLPKLTLVKHLPEMLQRLIC